MDILDDTLDGTFEDSDACAEVSSQKSHRRINAHFAHGMQEQCARCGCANVQDAIYITNGTITPDAYHIPLTGTRHMDKIIMCRLKYHLDIN